jgi:hypothetical protein
MTNIGNHNKSRIVELVHEQMLNARPTMTPDQQCSIVIVGIGSWDASNESVQPKGVSWYEQNMRQTLENIRMTMPISTAMFVWNTQPMALGTWIWATCPATDWRHAPLIEQYNAAAERAVNAINDQSSLSLPVRYLDTRFIMQPMWDSPADWYHFKDKVGEAEALFLAASIFDALDHDAVSQLLPLARFHVS